MKKRMSIMLAALAALWVLNAPGLALAACPEDPGVARALCNAFCNQAQCTRNDLPPGLENACANIADAYQQATGEEVFCEQSPSVCPCWDSVTAYETDEFGTDAITDSCTDDAAVFWYGNVANGDIASISWTTNLDTWRCNYLDNTFSDTFDAEVAAACINDILLLNPADGNWCPPG